MTSPYLNIQVDALAVGDPAVAEIVHNLVGQQQSKSEVSCLECAPRAVYLKLDLAPAALGGLALAYPQRLLHREAASWWLPADNTCSWSGW